MRIIYNGVDMAVQDTYDYQMASVMDPTGTDYLYTKHTIVARCIVNGQAEVFNGRVVDGKFFRNGPFMTYKRGGSAGGGVVANSDGIGGQAVGPFNTQRENPVKPTMEVLTGATGGPRANIPGVTTSSSGGGVGQPGGASLFQISAAPSPPGTTVATIRHRLTTPRGKLYIGSGGWSGAGATDFQIILQSPAQVTGTPDENGNLVGGVEAICDCKNGPFAKVFSITQAFGDATTFLVDFAVETYINESVSNVSASGGAAGQAKNPVNALLSNRFHQQQVVDETGHTTIHTEGLAIFRTDYLYGQRSDTDEINPDYLRPYLMLPIPQGFVRDNITVAGEPDVTGIRYSFTDRQVPVNFPLATQVRAASIHAVHRQAVVINQDILEGALSVYDRTLGTLVNQNFAQQGGGRRRTPGPVTAITNPPPPAP